MGGYSARARVDVPASRERVWNALTQPTQIAAYMFGAKVDTTWDVGSEITWSGEYGGTSYQDRGEVLIYDKPRTLSMTHYSPLGGQPDVPENYHVLVYELTNDDGLTHLTLTQDGCDDEEQARRFGVNWQAMLDGLRRHVEGPGGS